MREGVSEGWRGIAHRGGAEGWKERKKREIEVETDEGREKWREGGRVDPHARLPLSTGQWRHKSGIPGMRYIARGWRPGGYKL